jgi:hypothetical protein
MTLYSGILWHVGILQSDTMGNGEHRYEIDKISTHTTDGHKQHVVMLFKPILNHHASYGV